MATKAKGRGAVAAFGLFLLFAGLVGGGVLYVVAEGRPGEAVEGFARAPVGCTTTFEFSETGDFFVYEEVGAILAVGSCQPVATPDADFAATFRGEPVPAVVVEDNSVSYDVDGFDGRSVQRITIDEPGQYTVDVVGGDLTVVAAIGRDPDDGVDELRRNALIVAIAGVVIGLILLVLSGRRSKRAAQAVMPDGPGWAPAQRFDDGEFQPAAPQPGQVPVNPHAPNAPASAEVPTAPLSSLDQASAPPAPTWAVPPTGVPTDDMPAPDLAVAPDAAGDESDDPEEPVLPDTPGRPSGT